MGVEKEKVGEEQLKQEFSASADLQVEFGGDVKSYVAFKRAESQGRVKGHLGETKSSVPASGAGAEAGDEEALKQEFSASADLQAEFGGDVTAYLKFKKVEAAGRAKMCSGHGVVAFSSAPAPKEERVPDSEVSARTEKTFHRDELRQYAAGVPCQP